MGSDANDDSTAMRPISRGTPWGGPSPDQGSGVCSPGVSPQTDESGPAKDAPTEPAAEPAVIKRLSFVSYSESGLAMVRFYDARTGELLREIPPQAPGASDRPPRPATPVHAHERAAKEER